MDPLQYFGGHLVTDIQTKCLLEICRAAGAFRKGGPQTEVGSSLSSDIYTTTKISELVIIEVLNDLGSLGLGI